MGKLASIIWITILAIIVAIAGVALYLTLALPNVGPAGHIKVDITAARLARGQYLSNAIIACNTCHSKRDWNKYAAPIVQGTIGQGGERFDKGTDFPGILYATNITPYHLNNWTDGEILRAITEGETKDGKAIFPIMAYRAYAKMSREDAYSIIAYLRNLPAIKNNLPERELDFPYNLIVNTVPERVILSAAPDSNNKINYGRYLVSIANCLECHSIAGSTGIVAGSEFGGGWPFKFANGNTIYAANISPDTPTGIGKWEEAFFINRFKQYADSNKLNILGDKDFNTTMPWRAYAAITRKDLSAIYMYLKTVKPVRNKVPDGERNNMK